MFIPLPQLLAIFTNDLPLHQKSKDTLYIDDTLLNASNMSNSSAVMKLYQYNKHVYNNIIDIIYTYLLLQSDSFVVPITAIPIEIKHIFFTLSTDIFQYNTYHIFHNQYRLVFDQSKTIYKLHTEYTIYLYTRYNNYF